MLFNVFPWWNDHLVFFSFHLFIEERKLLMLNFPCFLGIKPCMPLVCCSLKFSWTQFADILFSIFAWAQAPDPFLVCPYPAVELIPTGRGGGSDQNVCMSSTRWLQLSSSPAPLPVLLLLQVTLPAHPHPGQHPCLLIPLTLYTPSPSPADSFS